MANPEHLEIPKQGVEVWSKRRSETRHDEQRSGRFFASKGRKRRPALPAVL